MRITDATVLVTGGSSGLGAASVRALASRGARVVVADLVPPAEPLSVEIAGRVVYVPADVTREADVRAAIEAARQQFGGLHGAVTCAGVLHAQRMLGRDSTASLDAFRRVVDVNLTGTFNAVRLAAEAIAAGEPQEDGERGVIVMTSSVAAFDGQIGQASYAASKGGVAALTLPLARELAGRGIRVVSLAPGVFETPMTQAAPEKVRQSLLDQTAFPRRFGQPDEFGSLVLHAFENRMLNGCVLRLDAALRMGPQ